MNPPELEMKCTVNITVMIRDVVLTHVTDKELRVLYHCYYTIEYERYYTIHG